MRKFIVFMVLNICSFCAYATNDKTYDIYMQYKKWIFAESKV